METILASASPRRKRLLAKLVRKFSVVPAEINERLLPREPYSRACVRLAEKKAAAVAAKRQSATVIGVDTIAYRGKKIFRKTGSEGKARAILRFLSGKTHTVATGVCIVFPSGKRVKYCEKAAVKMKKLADARLGKYLKSGEWKGRAGSYDISGKGSALIARVKGEKETVAGLPLRKLRKILRACESL